MVNKINNEINKDKENSKTKLVMKDDIMFRTFFGRKKNTRFLKSFIEAILKEKVEIKSIVHDSKLEQIRKEDKYGVLDIDIELQTGEQLNIEMQRQDLKNIEKRTMYYGAKKITEQIKTKQKYNEIKKTIIIAILDYSFIELPEYVTETVRVAKGHREYEINNDIKYYYIELDKFRKSNPDMEDELNGWLAFLDMERGDLLEMAKEKSEIIREAVTEYEELTGEEEIQRIAEVRLRNRLEEGDIKYIARQEGEKKKQKEIAKKMLEEKFSIIQIEKITGLTKEEVEKIKAEK